MCQSFDLTEEEFDEAWKLMPEQDRAFISALSYLNELFEDDMLRYRELPIEMQQFIAEADRGTCFSALAECLAALLGTSVMVRVKRRRHSHSGSNDGDHHAHSDDSSGEDVSASEADTLDDARPDNSSRTKRRRRSRRDSRIDPKDADHRAHGNGENGDNDINGHNTKDGRRE